MLGDPRLNLASDREVSLTRPAVLFLPRPIGPPNRVAELPRQPIPMGAAPPHGWWNLRLATRPVAGMRPRLPRGANVIGLAGNRVQERKPPMTGAMGRRCVVSRFGPAGLGETRWSGSQSAAMGDRCGKLSISARIWAMSA